MPPTLSVLIVAWNSREELARTLPALLPELGEGDELIVVDNDSGDGTAERGPRARARRRASRRAATTPASPPPATPARARRSGDLLVILNPDAAPHARLGRGDPPPLAARNAAGPPGRRWSPTAAASGSTPPATPSTSPGIVWAGGHGRPIAEAPPAGEVTSLSGACLAIPRATWERSAASRSDFFLYHEDVDLSLRLRLAGGALGIEPAAVVDHEYEFGAREHKWRWLERNRLRLPVRVYPASLLILLAPALLATELALIPSSRSRRAGGGRSSRAILEALAWLPRLLRERRQIQATRSVSTAEFASWLTPDLDSPFIPAIARSLPARLALRGYWRLVLLLLGRR